ncbi:MAG: hypothetical protein RL227_2435, partial [Pseudomonadota bacterium]
MNRGVGPGASTGSARTEGVADTVRAEPVEAPVAHRGPEQVPPTRDNTLTVLYDGACPLCRREIAHAQGLAERSAGSALCFVDISTGARHSPAERAALLARFHVQRSDGTRLDGAA